MKLALDSVLLGGFDSDAELLDTLQEYSSGWYIGLDTDPGWRQAVLGNTPALFSLGYDDNRVRRHSGRQIVPAGLEGRVADSGRAGIRYFFGTGGIGIQYLETGHSVSVFRYFPETGHSVSVLRYCISVLKEKTSV